MSGTEIGAPVRGMYEVYCMAVLEMTPDRSAEYGWSDAGPRFGSGQGAPDEQLERYQIVEFSCNYEIDRREI